MKNISEIHISGRVIRGDNFGKVLGFPTANLDRRQYQRRHLKIRFGVYCGQARLPSGRKYRAAIVIGPKDRRGLPKLEAHLLGFKGDLYGLYLNIYLNIYLRPFKKYPSIEQLRRQIKKDLKLLKTLE